MSVVGLLFTNLYLTLNQSIIYIHSKAQTSDHISAGGPLGCKHASKYKTNQTPDLMSAGGLLVSINMYKSYKCNNNMYSNSPHPPPAKKKDWHTCVPPSPLDPVPA